MESLILSHKGKIVIYRKSTPKGVRNENRRGNENSIEEDSIGWKINSNARNSENVWITNEGRICYNSNEAPERVYLEDRIDQDKQSDDPIYCRAQELYSILRENIRKIIAYDNADWTPKSVIELRKKQLIGYLKLLGYNSISDIRKKEDPSGEYAALPRVGRKLEGYEGLDFVRRTEGSFFTENFIVNIPEFYSGEECDPEEVLRKYSAKIVGVEEEFQSDLEFVQKRNEDLDRSRGILPDYFSNMKRKMKPEEWNTYQLSVIKIAKLVMGLNYDILSMPDRDRIPDLTGLSEIEVKDKISQFIDDIRFFDTAADIENRYAIAESEFFIERVDELSESDETFQRGELASSLKELRDIAGNTIATKKPQTESYTQRNGMYRKMKQIIIKSPKDRDEEY